MINNLVKFVLKNSYLEVDSIEENEIIFSTRENGDVYSEKASLIDLNEAKKVRKLIRENFTNVEFDLDIVDEWVMLTVTF
jgi:DNA-dependent RNA polymerase auxiliary subunit epsilon